MSRRLTAYQRDLLVSMVPEVWYTPQHLGGTDGSHHSATLTCLAKRGLVERMKSCRHSPGGRVAADLIAREMTNPWPWCSCKGSCTYRLTEVGVRVAAKWKSTT